jgi:hypothetical protein
MRGLLVSVGVCAAMLSAGCGGSPSPTGPSTVLPGTTSIGTTADVAATSSMEFIEPLTSKMVPFKGDLEGQYGTPAGEFPLIRESIHASGHATHLGRYTLDIAETVNLLQASATGTFTFIAANGDTLYGSFTGQAQPGPLVSIVENAAVVGGTGRFEGATGGFSINRVFDPVSRTTTGSFEGVISSPGAGKH